MLLTYTDMQQIHNICIVYNPPCVCLQVMSLLCLTSHGKGLARDFKQTQL